MKANTEAATRVVHKKDVLQDFPRFTGKHQCQSLFFKKDTMAQVLSCESWEIIENIIFTEHPRVAASANKRFKKRTPSEAEAAIGDVL